MITYFVFVGEFGYELLNWQGAIKKLSRVRPRTHLICASRPGVAPLYETFRYVDIGDVPRFAESIATGYFALPEPDTMIGGPEHLEFDGLLRRDLKTAIRAKLRAEDGLRADARRAGGERWVFSSSRTVLHECTFGANPALYALVPGEGNIYDGLDLNNNAYLRLPAAVEHRAALERQAGLDLSEPYVLVQARRRDIRARSTVKIDEQGLLDALGRHLTVLLVDFDTGRAGDSYSRPDEGRGVRRVSIAGFPEQSCLIHHARACVFLSEGDFGSHIYVPPMLGRDVHAVVPRDIYGLGTTPIDFWNRNVFRAGGQIVAHVAEDLATPAAMEAFAADVAGAALERV